MKRSLSLCASIALLAASSSAMSLKSVQLSADLGSRVVTIGDPTDVTNLKLLGGAKATTTVASTGTVTSVTHRTPLGVIGLSAVVPFSDKFGLKLAAEVHVPDSSTHIVYNGLSQTATVVTNALGPVNDTNGSGANGTAGYTGSYGIVSATGGNRKLTVDHQRSYGIKALYAFGEHHHGAAIGFGALWTSDEYKYDCDEDPTAGTGVGVYSTTNGYNFANPAFATAAAAPTSANATAGTAGTATTYTPVAGTQLAVSDKHRWWGVVGEAATEFNENISINGGFGYYRTDFDVSTGQTVSAPMVVESAKATMYVGHVGVGVKRSDS